jgi:hypothetical protein
MLLQDAATSPKETRSKQIDKVIESIKKQNPEKFFHDTFDEIDPAMRDRVFYDEPIGFKSPIYKYCVQKYLGTDQLKEFKQRDKILLKK